MTQIFGLMDIESSSDSGSGGVFHVRDLYRRLIFAEPDLATIEGADAFCSMYLKKHEINASLDFLEGAATNGLSSDDFVQQIIDAAHHDVQSMHSFEVSSDVTDFVLRQYAPLGLLSGCVLQSCFHPGISGGELSCALHRVHRGLLDVRLEQTAGTRFRDRLRSLGVILPPVHGHGLSGRSDIADRSFELPTFLLSLAQVSARRMPEILGAALYEVLHGAPKIVRYVDKGDPSRTNNVEASTRRCEVPSTIADMKAAIGLFLKQTESAVDHNEAYRDAVRRLIGTARAIAAAQREWTRWLLDTIIGGYFRADQRMLRLLEGKAKYALGYHGAVLVGGCPFDSLLNEAPEVLLQRLSESSFVSPGHPEKSFLLTTLLSPRGKMFRIFQPWEINVIHDWIVWLGEERATAQTQHVATKLEPLSASIDRSRVSERSGAMPPKQLHFHKKRSARVLYHLLLNIDKHPDAIVHANLYARRWLSAAEARLKGQSGRLPVERYSLTNLRAWFDEMVHSQFESYSPTSDGPDKTRAQVVDEAVQLCPLVLIDGAWLQKWSSADLCDTAIGQILYTIYSDEIGNGRSDLNHPNIYRALMRQMGVVVPDVCTREFAYWEVLKDSAFDVPTFWLSLAQSPRSFLPETLGLNLSMELSGVGGAYRTARDELRHYGFSSHFVDLHNTIDNVSTGHSAMALDAIAIYMDEISAHANSVDIDKHWKRIWTGYIALSPQRRYGLFKQSISRTYR
jgi:hypothetical protein